MQDHLGLNASRDVVLRPLKEPALDAIAAATTRGGAGIVLAHSGVEANRRFRLSRAIYGLIFTPSMDGSVVSLVTGAQTPAQAESRAFAAELLLPASLLRRELSHQHLVSDDRIDRIARKHRVSRLLVAHQIENHRIASIPTLTGAMDSFS